MKNGKKDKAIMLLNQLIRLVAGAHTHKSMKEALTEQRRVVSQLYCEIVGVYPTQDDLEKIDPLFKELITRS